jgi:hypothetical protein
MEGYTSYIVKRDNSSITRKDKIMKRYPELQREFGKLSIPQLKFMLRREKKMLIFIDIFCMFIDLIVVTWLYFDHFNFISNDFKIDNTSNTARLICMGLSIAVIFAIILRLQNKRRYDNLKFIMNMRNKCNKKIKF